MAHLLSVRNLRGCEAADIEIDGITLVAGRNGAGKSSIIGAARAALLGVVPGTKKDAGQLIKDGAKSGTVQITNATGFSKMFLPDCAPSTKGEPPRCSPVAAGGVSPLDLADKDRAKLLADVLRADPDAEDLTAALRDAGLTDGDIEKAVELLGECPGWDEAHARAREGGAKSKGLWEGIAGRKYGSQVAASWLPEGWTPDLDRVEQDDLQGDIQAARRTVDGAIAADAVDQAEISRLETTAAGRSEAEGAVERAKGMVAEAADLLAQARTAHAAIPPAAGGLPCPHCGGFVHIKTEGPATKLVAAEKLSATDTKAREKAESDANRAVVGRQRELDEARRAQIEAENALKAATAAGEALAKAKPVGAGGGSIDVASARHALDQAEKRLAMFTAKGKADAAHRRVLMIQSVIDALAPDGVRKTKLGRVLTAFNDGRLGGLCDAAGWPRLVITPDLAAELGGRPYALCSESERWRCRAVLQLAIALIDGSELVLLDGADILDLPGRDALFMMLLDAELPALVGMTIGSPERAPDLGAADCGSTWWIEAGVCKALAEAVPQKAAA